MANEYDLIVIGSGTGGYVAAIRAAQLGLRTAVVERAPVLGGTCLNWGCIPTKALLEHAHALKIAQGWKEWGLTIGEAAIGIDMAQVQARKDKIVKGLTGGIELLFRKNKIDWIKGSGRLAGKGKVEITDGQKQTISARKEIVVATGSQPRSVPGVEIDRRRIITSDEAIGLKDVPKSIVILGSGAVGVEFGSIFRRFGSEVTIVEMADRLIRREDPDVSGCVAEILECEGIHLRLNATCIGFEDVDGRPGVNVECHAGPPTVVGTHVLLAVGRRPNTADLGLERAGIAVDPTGYITVDDELRTNVDGVWALGDCNGRGAFTHTSYNDAEIVVANLLDNDRRRVSDRIPTYGLFIDPPLGRAGMTDADVKKSGRRALVATRPMTKVKRAVEKGESQGFMKIAVDADTKEILGAAVLGPGGDEVIHSILDVMYARKPYTLVQRAMHIHPTVSELLPTLLGDLQPM